MEKCTRVLTKIAEKIFRVLDVFDFSYIISGATACVLIYLYFLFTDNQDVLLKLNEIRWYIVILIAYILGLIMFATGRFIRQEILGDKKRKYDLFVDYGITNKTDEEIDALFCKYWDKLQNSETYGEYEYYKRLWVMTAVYEGLIGVCFFALLFSIYPIFNMFNSDEGECACLLLKAILIILPFIGILIILCIESRKYADTVVKDLIVKNNDYLSKNDIK